MSELPRFKRPTAPAACSEVPPPGVPPKSRPQGRGATSTPPHSHTSTLLSLCMIVRDEEERLGECLRSVRPYVDEMIVVDTGSRDRTPHVAEECGARVFQMPWPESFAAARNQSLEQARGEWIFWMDADDVITPECGAGLRQLIRSAPREGAAYQVQVRIPPGPGEFSTSVVDHVKLFPNRPELRFEHRIHEQILPAVRRLGLEVRFSDLYVTHKNYDRSDRGQEKKRKRDFRLLELDLRDHPEHPFVLFNLGMTYLHATKEFEVAAQYLRRSLDQSHPADSIVRKAYAMLTTARICQFEWELAIQANEEGRGHYPDDAELLFQAGQVYQQLGRFDLGRLALERLLQGADDPHYRSVDEGLRTYRGRHELALLYRRMGDPAHCARVLQELLAAHPHYLPAQTDLVETLHTLGRQAEAYALLQQLPNAKGVKDDLQRLRVLPWDSAAIEDAKSHSGALLAGLTRQTTFRFQGRDYPYLVHSYNSTATNERCVEVPLVQAAVAACPGEVLEIGNVLAHYGVQGHTVVDRYETAPGVLNVDIAEYAPGRRFDLVVSISTLEHVGWDEPEGAQDPEKLARVLHRLRTAVLAPGGTCLATVPLGYNPHLDRLVLDHPQGLNVQFIRRLNAENQWEECPREAVGQPRYDHPYPQGNVLAVLTYTAPTTQEPRPEWEARLEEAFAAYVPGYQSHAGMAISPAVARMLWRLAEERRPRKILDLGAGFSSFMLRYWAEQQSPPAEVWSVDDSAGWLEAAQRFLHSQGVGTERLLDWETFQAQGEAGFDLIVHDLGNHEVRMGVLEQVVSLARPGGLVVLDDFHWSIYREQAAELVAREGHTLEIREAETLDEFGRYAGLLTRAEGGV